MNIHFTKWKSSHVGATGPASIQILSIVGKITQEMRAVKIPPTYIRKTMIASPIARTAFWEAVG